jgi:4a-hydroxytetrahydrobiopterin dehydratase
MGLAEQNCVPLQTGQPPLAVIQVRELEQEIPSWRQQGDMLEREFNFSDFSQSMIFVNQVAKLAQAQEHHPDFSIAYNKVRLTLSTHKIHGLSMNDFILAAKIDKLYEASLWHGQA